MVLFTTYVSSSRPKSSSKLILLLVPCLGNFAPQNPLCLHSHGSTLYPLNDTANQSSGWLEVLVSSVFWNALPFEVCRCLGLNTRWRPRYWVRLSVSLLSVFQESLLKYPIPTPLRDKLGWIWGDRRAAVACYARRTLVGRGKTKLSQGRCLRRDVTSLIQMERLRSSVECFKGSQAECLWTRVYTRLRRTRIENIVQAAGYLYYGTRKHRTP